MISYTTTATPLGLMLLARTKRGGLCLGLGRYRGGTIGIFKQGISGSDHTAG